MSLNGQMLYRPQVLLAIPQPKLSRKNHSANLEISPQFVLEIFLQIVNYRVGPLEKLNQKTQYLNINDLNQTGHIRQGLVNFPPNTRPFDTFPKVQQAICSHR